MRNVITLANCEDGNCPGIDQWTDTEDFRVQGYRVAQGDKPAGLPAEEDVVMIPRDVLLPLIAQLQQRLTEENPPREAVDGDTRRVQRGLR